MAWQRTRSWISRQRRQAEQLHRPDEPIPCMFEALEPRVLLSATLVDGLLTIEGTARRDQIALSAGLAAGDVVVDQAPGVAGGTTYSGVDQIIILGRARNDRIVVGDNIVDTAGSVIGVRIDGGGGDDTILGGSGDDVLVGGAGDDVIDGGGGRDTLDYSASTSGVEVLLRLSRTRRDGRGGRDELANVENVIGSAFNDDIRGDNQRNVIHGGDGDDFLRGGAGKDRLFGDNGDDVIYGNAGNDRIYGGNGMDVLYGDAGRDVIFGDNGDDTIFGGAGDDWLFGWNGFDTIVGGDGLDRLFGGRGPDSLTQ